MKMTKHWQITASRVCPNCYGKGVIPMEGPKDPPCLECAGTGELTRQLTLEALAEFLDVIRSGLEGKNEPGS